MTAGNGDKKPAPTTTSCPHCGKKVATTTMPNHLRTMHGAGK